MNHRPFESWLLEELDLTPGQKHELHLHLRECRDCAALAESGVALRSARVRPPAPGFAARFEGRLISHHRAERRRRLWGSLLLAAVGSGLFAWWIAPAVGAFVASPATSIAAWVQQLLHIALSARAILEVTQIMFRIVPDLAPSYLWMVLSSTLAGLGLLWSLSLWRFARGAQGV